jgi:hypothetical protein
MEAAAALEAPLHALKAFRQPSVHVQRVAQVLLLLLGKRPPSEYGVWRWEDVRAGLRDRRLLPLLAAFDPRSVDEASVVVASGLMETLSAERIARVSRPMVRVFRWCATQLQRVDAALNEGALARGAVDQVGSEGDEENAYADEDFEEDSDRQIGDEEDASDRALWRQQQASTVLTGDFDYSILDGAMVSMVVKFLGAGHGALLLQTKVSSAT